jgi:hypothetical protein
MLGFPPTLPVIISMMISFAAPYLVVYVLTGFSNGTKGTAIQKVSIFAWCLLGQAFSFGGRIISRAREKYGNTILCTSIVYCFGLGSIAATCLMMIGVAKMILESGVCKKL